MHKIKKFLSSLKRELFRINDTPQKIALGLGLGVFSGMLPGTGPLAALFLAFALRANRASALLGSLLTNTWLSFLIFIPAVKTGAFILGLKWQDIYNSWLNLWIKFNWPDLFKLSILKITLPVILGFIIIAFCLGLLAYLLTLIVILARRNTLKQTK